MSLPTNFFIGRGGGSLDEFQLTLSRSTAFARQGETLGAINTFLSTNLANDPGYVTAYGSGVYSSYNGYYAVQFGVDTEVAMNVGGASGGYMYNSGTSYRICGYGRYIHATFSVLAGQSLVFFVGSVGENVPTVTNQGGTGGGASCVFRKYSNSNTLEPLVVAAGGSGSAGYADAVTASHQQNAARPYNSAVPLTSKGTGSHSGIRFERAKFVTYVYGSTDTAGIGRGTAGMGGGGMYEDGRDASGTSNHVGRGRNLIYGADGGQNGSAQGANGGFGGGGAQYGGNGYAAAGGGYFGGYECAYVTPGEITEYRSYSQSTGGNLTERSSNETGPVSYVDINATSWQDAGIWGSPSTTTSDPKKGGYVRLTMNQI